jgi:endoglucanase
VATPSGNAQFQLRKADGTVLATIYAPNTGAYQTFQTVSANVNLSAGAQTLKIISTSPWGTVFNLNWLELVAPGSTSYAAVQRSTDVMTTEATASSSAALDVFPNPVTDRFALQVNNDLSGTLNVQIVDLQGAVVKQFTLSKAAAGSSQFYLSIGDLPAANYIVKATMNNWNQSKQITKEYNNKE